MRSRTGGTPGPRSAHRSSAGGWWSATPPATSSAPRMRTAPFRPLPDLLRADGRRGRHRSGRVPSTSAASSSAVPTERCPAPAGLARGDGASCRAGDAGRRQGTPGSGRRPRSTVPPAPEGRLRRGHRGRRELVLAWFTAFHDEADEQAGREPDPHLGRAQHPRQRARADPRGRGVGVGAARRRGRPPDRRRPAVVRRQPDRSGLHAQGAPRCAASRRTSSAS